MNLITAVLVMSFMVLIALGAWHEVRIYSQFRRAGTDRPRHRRRLFRRLFGFFFLALAVAILTNTSTFERYVNDLVLQLAWIGMAFVSVMIAIGLAFRDLSETGKIAQEEAQRVVLESLANLQEEIARAKQEKSGQDGGNAPSPKTADHGQSRQKTRRNRRTRHSR